MTSDSPHIKSLDNARNKVNAILKSLEELTGVASGLSSSPDIMLKLAETHAAFQQTSIILKKPSLRIVTIGTTSSGKSTLVNGLVGRQIAPMNADEMSAGVLHLVHAERNRLYIRQCGDLWPETDQLGLSNDEMYETVRNGFKTYNEKKADKELPMPEIRIEAPLFPAVWPELLGLPEGVGIEMFDLPGLNSVKDKKNLKIIQKYLKECFSLVVMDYSHTDRTARDKLFSEVKEIVDNLPKGYPILFILNRIDNRKKTDDPLDERLTQLKHEIKEKLGLPDEPDIIPSVSLALYYAQCAWWGGRDGNPTDKKSQSNLIKEFIEDCATFIKRYQNKDIKQWLDGIENESDKDIPDELLEDKKLFKWQRWVYESSGGGEIWKQLKDRVQKSFGEVVIAPILIKPRNSLEALLQMINGYCKTQEMKSQDSAKKKKAEFEREFKDLESFLENKRLEFKEKFDETVKSVQDAFSKRGSQSESTEIDRALGQMFNIGNSEQHIEHLKKQMEEHLEKFRTIVRDIKKDLTDTIIIPVRDFYFAEQLDDLQEKLKILPDSDRKKLIDVIVKYKKLYDDERCSIHEDLKRKVRDGDKQGENKI